MAIDPSANDPSFTWGAADRANLPTWEVPDQRQQRPLDQRQLPLPEHDVDEQWFFQFQEHLLLTVQAIQRLQAALHVRMP